MPPQRAQERFSERPAEEAPTARPDDPVEPGEPNEPDKPDRQDIPDETGELAELDEQDELDEQNQSLEGSAPDAVIVPALSGSIADMKALRNRCLEVGIPAAIGCPPGAGKGCGPRTHLLVHEHDLPQLAALLGDDWRSQLAREGLAPIAVTADEDAEHLPCPACGTAAPLVEGACSDCGLQLE